MKTSIKPRILNNFDYDSVWPEIEEVLEKGIGEFKLINFMEGLDAVDKSKAIKKYLWTLETKSNQYAVKLIISKNDLWNENVITEMLNEISFLLANDVSIHHGVFFLPNGWLAAWFSREWIKGTSYLDVISSGAGFTEREQYEIAGNLGDFLTGIHKPLEVNSFRKRNLVYAKLISRPSGILDVVNHFQNEQFFPALYKTVIQNLPWIFQLLSDSTIVGTVHGDFYPANILISDLKEVKPIDWEIGSTGVAEDDIAALLVNYSLLVFNNDSSVSIKKLIFSFLNSYKRNISWDALTITVVFRFLSATSPVWYHGCEYMDSVVKHCIKILEGKQSINIDTFMKIDS